MPGLLIIAHAPLASALKAVAVHVDPEHEAAVETFDVPATMGLDEAEARGREILQRVRDPEALILTDAFGATPCNAAQRLGDGNQVKVVVGVNVPMLLRALGKRDESLDGMVARALAGATQGVMQVAVSKPQNQTNKPGGNDQGERHHQQ